MAFEGNISLPPLVAGYADRQQIRRRLLRQPVFLPHRLQIGRRVAELGVAYHCRLFRARSHASSASRAMRGAFLICSSVRFSG